LKLLFDANLSPKLVGLLKDLFPGSLHIFDTSLVRNTPDQAIWDYARDNNLTIVSADSDFVGIAKSKGAPPKVVRIEDCDFRTAEVEALLRRYSISIAEMEHSSQDVLVIRRTT